MSDTGHVIVRRESRFPGEREPSMTQSLSVNDLRNSGGEHGAAGKALLPARNLLLDQEEQLSKGHLAGLYGDKVHVAQTPEAGRHAMMLSWHVPDEMHQRLAREGFRMHVVDGPVTDVLTDLKGQHSHAHDVTNPTGITWDQVTGVMDPNSKQVVVGAGARPGTALHEAAHALDVTARDRLEVTDAISSGHASDTAAFRDAYRIAGRSKALWPYYRDRGDDSSTGRMEFFAESFGNWLKNREKPAPERRRRMSVALAGGRPGAPKIAGMAALDQYYSWLYGRLISG
jgi:hypothetical protein